MAEGMWQLRTDPVCMGLWTQCFQEYWSHHDPEFPDAPAPPLWGQVGLMVEIAQALRTQACSCPVVSTQASPHTDPGAALCSRLLPHSPWAGLQGDQEPPSPVSPSLGPRPRPQCSWGPPGALPTAHQSWSCPRWPAAPGKGWCHVTGAGHTHHFCRMISRSPWGVGLSSSTFTLRGPLSASRREMSLAAMATECHVPATWGGTLSCTPGRGP